MMPGQNKKTRAWCPYRRAHYITAPAIVLLGGGGGAEAEGEQSCPIPGGAAPCILRRPSPCCPQRARDG